MLEMVYVWIVNGELFIMKVLLDEKKLNYPQMVITAE